MGEPTQPNAEQRANTLKYARDMIDAVTNDEDDGDSVLTTFEVFRLAQDLLDARAALDEACDVIDVMADGRGVWLNGKLELASVRAERLRRLDLEGK